MCAKRKGSESQFVTCDEMLESRDTILKSVTQGQPTHILRPSGISVIRVRPAAKDEAGELRNMTLSRFRSIVEDQREKAEILTKAYSLNSSDIEGVGEDLIIEPIMPGIDREGNEVYPTEVQMPGTRLKNQRDVWWDLISDGKVRLILTRSKEPEYIVSPLDTVDMTKITKNLSKSEVYGLVSGGGADALKAGEVAVIQDKNRKLDTPQSLGVMVRAEEVSEQEEAPAQASLIQDDEGAEPEVPQRAEESMEQVASSAGPKWKIGNTAIRPKEQEAPFAEEVEMVSISGEGVSRFYVVHHVAPEEGEELTLHNYEGEDVVLSDAPPENWKEQKLRGGSRIWLPAS